MKDANSRLAFARITEGEDKIFFKQGALHLMFAA